MEALHVRVDPDLVTSIRREHEATRQALEDAVDHAIRCGGLLLEVKNQLPHGAWLPWVAEHFPASKRTAQGYIRLARHGKAQALAHLGIEGALKRLSSPPTSVTVDDEALHTLWESTNFIVNDDEIDAEIRVVCERAGARPIIEPIDKDPSIRAVWSGYLVENTLVSHPGWAAYAMVLGQGITGTVVGESAEDNSAFSRLCREAAEAWARRVAK